MGIYLYIHPDDFTEANGIIHNVYGLAIASVSAGAVTWFLFLVYISVPHQMQPKDIYVIILHFCPIHVTIHIYFN